MIRPAIIALGLDIPLFAVFDADGDKIAKPDIRTRHHRDNLALVRLFGGNEADIFPVATVWAAKFVMWPSDLGDTIETEFVAALGVQGKERFDDIKNRANAQCGNAGDLEKNSIFISNMLSLVQDAGVTSKSLDQLCDAIMSFANLPSAAVRSVAGDEVVPLIAAVPLNDLPLGAGGRS
jgi:putative ATP-dependent endonuclease of OLD family